MSGETAGHPIPLRQLRVLCIGNGGVVRRSGEYYTDRSLARFLTELGAQVREVTLCAWLDRDNEPLADTPLAGVHHVRCVGLPRFDGGAIEKWSNGLVAFITLATEIVRADLTYLFWPGRLSSVAARLCRLAGKRYGIYFRGEDIPRDPAMPRIFAGARFALATGQILREIAAKYCGDVEAVTPMLDLRMTDIQPPREAPRGGPWRLLYVGRVEERKGVFDLLEAMSILEADGVAFHLTVVGHCYDREGVARAMKPRVADRVTFAGAITDATQLARYYRAADAFILPSHDEGFPRVLYEAMACGVPILTTFVGSVSSVMVDGQNCLKLDVGNPRDIAKKTMKLFDCPNTWRGLSTGARQTAITTIGTWSRPHAVQVADRLVVPPKAVVPDSDGNHSRLPGE